MRRIISLVVLSAGLIALLPASVLGAAPTTASPTRAASTVAARPSYEQTKRWVNSYRRAHPGRSGDINAAGPADAIGRRLLAACGRRQRPVFPLLAWEYGGHDHAWKHPEESALAYCVYSPVKPSTTHWKYAHGRVTADVYVLFPAKNPCRDRRGADKVLGCLGDPSNSEILVDTASLHDGHDAGLELSEASTTLMLILPGRHTKVPLIHNP